MTTKKQTKTKRTNKNKKNKQKQKRTNKNKKEQTWQVEANVAATSYIQCFANEFNRLDNGKIRVCKKAPVFNKREFIVVDNVSHVHGEHTHFTYARRTDS